MSKLRTTYVKAWAPATVANVGPGFDIFGFALERPGDTVEVWKSPQPGVRIVEITGDGGALSAVSDKNVASAVAIKMLRDAKAKFGLDLWLTKGLPLGSGLGSSSASAAAAAVAVARLLGDRCSEAELLDYARFGEEIACGSAHADNVAAALFGGFTIVRHDDIPEIVRLKPPSDWFVAVVHPHAVLETRRARRAVPRTVAMSDHVANSSNAAAAIAAIAMKNLELFGRAVMADRVVETARAPLIPGYGQVVRAALRERAAGVAISGAGPSLFALTSGERRAKVIGASMAAAWKRAGIAADVVTSKMGAPGAKILKAGVSDGPVLASRVRPLQRHLSS